MNGLNSAAWKSTNKLSAIKISKFPPLPKIKRRSGSCKKVTLSDLSTRSPAKLARGQSLPILLSPISNSQYNIFGMFFRIPMMQQQHNRPVGRGARSITNPLSGMSVTARVLHVFGPRRLHSCSDSHDRRIRNAYNRDNRPDIQSILWGKVYS